MTIRSLFDLTRKALFALTALSLITLYSCGGDDDPIVTPGPQPTGNELTYSLAERNGSGVSGTITFKELDDQSIEATFQLQGTPAGGSHPSHIHFDNAATGGGIAVSFEPVDGSTGSSVTTFSTLDNGTAIAFGDLSTFDGYINVHLSADDLGTVVAQADIGSNVLTGETKVYPLGERAVAGISGTATFAERENGEALLTIMLENTPEGGEHPAHIHFNSYAEGGGIALSLNPVNGTTGMSLSNIATLDDGTALDYAGIMDYNGYINVHLSADELGTVVAQGDIGSNELTGESKEYMLGSRAVDNISGMAKFEQRKDGTALVTLMLENTPSDGSHPAHIHMNSYAEGGGIAASLAPVNGANGMSMTSVRAFDDGTATTYEALLDYNGYINVHLSADELGTIVAQGDIGSNELTGESKEYMLGSRAVDNISGMAKFEQRKDGTALVTLMLENTPDGGSHPAHIHMNSYAEGGGIAASLTPVNGTTGMSMTSVRAFDDGTATTYEALLDYNGYINVHLSADELGTIVAQGDIGSNELTGESIEYTLNELAVPGISGTAKFEERKDGTTLVTIMLQNTPDGGSHPAHIHNNSAAEGGGIAASLTPVNGTTGMSMTSVRALDDGTAITYSGLLGFDGYINVHLSADELGTIVAQGNIGSNG